MAPPDAAAGNSGRAVDRDAARTKALLLHRSYSVAADEHATSSPLCARNGVLTPSRPLRGRPPPCRGRLESLLGSQPHLRLDLLDLVVLDAEIGRDHLRIVADAVAACRRRSSRRSRAPRCGRRSPSPRSCRARSAGSRCRARSRMKQQQLVELGAFARVEAGRRLVEAEQHRIACTWRARSRAGAGRRRARLPAPSSARASKPDAVEPVARLLDRGAFGVCDRPEGRAGRASVKPEAAISALCCATTRFSSTVMPANRRMFWKVRATVRESARCEESAGRRSSRNAEPSGCVQPDQLPGARLVEAGDAVEHRGLAGAVRADDRGDLAAPRAKAEVVAPRPGRRSAWSDARPQDHRRVHPRPSSTSADRLALGRSVEGARRDQAARPPHHDRDHRGAEHQHAVLLRTRGTARSRRS